MNSKNAKNTHISFFFKNLVMVLTFHDLVINSYILHFGDNEPPADYPTTFAIREKRTKQNPNQHPNPQKHKKQNYTQSSPSN